MFATVSFGGSAQTALLVPSEALIRTGKRTLVMLALDKGRYQPAEVQTGQESANDTEILAGLREGEKIVASGQFLIDSEASLPGVEARRGSPRSEAHTSELQSLMRSSYAVFCSKNKTPQSTRHAARNSKRLTTS